MPEPSSVASILEREDIVELETDIRSFSLSELEHHFGAHSSGRIVITRVIKNLVWQAVSFVRRGKVDAVKGNLRSFYYQWVKPVMARIPGALEQERDPYNTMLEVFVELVEKYQLFHYADLDLDDENYEYKIIGEKQPQLMVFSEKRGLFRVLKGIHKSLGVTVVALGGYPSLLSNEYLVRELTGRLGQERQVVTFGIVDWDPSGHQIARAQLRQLESLGLEVTQHHDVVRPEHYSQQELELFQYPLPRRQKTKNQKWLERTGGIDGQLRGLESDSMPRNRLKVLLKKKIKPYLLS